MNLHDIRKAVIGHGPKGWDNPSNLTLLDEVRLDNLVRRLKELDDTDIAGDIVETGVWRGGASILMAACSPKRTVWACDTFTGFPPNSLGYGEGFLAVSFDEVKGAALRLLGPDHNIRFVQGDFRKTLPGDIDDIALLHYDGDTGEGVRMVLDALYSKLLKDGFVIIDDYCLKDCRDGLLQWFKENPLDPVLMSPYIDKPIAALKNPTPCGVWWQK